METTPPSLTLTYNPKIDMNQAEMKALQFTPIQPSDGTEASYMPAVQYLVKSSTILSRRSLAAALNSIARIQGYQRKTVILPDQTIVVIPPWQQLD